jgi:bifunctional DNase/RNase
MMQGIASRAVLAAVFLLASLAARGAENPQARESEAALVRVERVEVRVSVVGPVVLLFAQKRAIPIFVDGVVAASIQAALSGEKLQRPLTHDLMRAVLEGFDGRVARVVIALKDQTYYADLTVLVGAATKVFDSRASDAIALAVHFGAPMLVSQELLDRVGANLDDPPAPKPRGQAL